MIDVYQFYRSAIMFLNGWKYSYGNLFFNSSFVSQLKSSSPSLLPFRLACPAMILPLRKNTFSPRCLMDESSLNSGCVTIWATGTRPTSQVFMLTPAAASSTLAAVCKI